MRLYARLHSGRILARGTGVWLRNALRMSAVAAFCLAPLVILPQSDRPFFDGRIFGLFGLHSTGWWVAADLLSRPTGLARNTTIGYLAQFAITVIVVRDAHRRLTGRPPRTKLLAMIGLAPLALGGVALFATLSGAVVITFVAFGGEGSPLAVPLIIGVTVAQSFVGASFWLALPAAALDGHRFLPALRRSRLLSKGSRSELFWLIAALESLSWILMIPCAFLVKAMPSQWVLAISPFVFVTLKGCILAAAYQEACVRKEGPKSDEVVEVFS